MNGGGEAGCVLMRFNLLPRQAYIEILTVLLPMNYLNIAYRSSSSSRRAISVEK